MLTLYRRHVKDCTKDYVQNFRVFIPSTEKAKLADCICPIAAEGVLGTVRISNRSTKKTEWDEAIKVAQQWVEWGATEKPVTSESDDPTVEWCVETFLTSIKSQADSTQKGFRVMLEKRLLPWCLVNQVTHMRQLDNLHFVTQFFQSWVNLETGEKLANSTQKTEIERLRALFAYCQERGWLKTNQAKNIKVKKVIAPKFGLSTAEDEKFFECLKLANTLLFLFCAVMRYAGLRISDATALCREQLIRRSDGEGWSIYIPEIVKTQKAIRVPIPMWLGDALVALPYKNAKGQYWFWTGVGTAKTAENNWYRSVKKFAASHQKLYGEFKHGLSPHTFRHTFSIRHLNDGVLMRTVSKWLGHMSTAITEAHYAHAIEETYIAEEEEYEEAAKRAAAKRKTKQQTAKS